MTYDDDVKILAGFRSVLSLDFREVFGLGEIRMTCRCDSQRTVADRTRTKLGAFSKPIIGPVKTRLETTPLAASAFN